MSDSSTSQLPVLSAAQRDQRELHAAHFAMRLSLVVGVPMLLGKTAEYMTGSAAIPSDFAQPVVHVIAVAFAAFSLRLCRKPAGPTFLYGYERITFFSAGFEGAMIVVGAIWILVEAIEKWLAGLKLEHLGPGAVLLLAAGLPACTARLVSASRRQAQPLTHSPSGRQARAGRQFHQLWRGGRPWPRHADRMEALSIRRLRSRWR